VYVDTQPSDDAARRSNSFGASACRHAAAMGQRAVWLDSQSTAALRTTTYRRPHRRNAVDAQALSGL
jgi:hypothetical protein